ncbi:Mlp family lipoprotein (plasmid) [Borreliella spielmanii]|uniref:Mlp family lipoprotein n=1 Tax=Borreliella spielmanii TaxID=88916 RepID=UPI003AB70279
MKIINILFCLFLIMLNGCNSNDNNTLKNNAQQSQSRKKRDLSQEKPQEEKPKSKEELLIEKLTDDQKTQLNWLKDTLENEKFDKFLENDESKIKEALNHIKSELDKCTGKDQADEQKNTFKTIVKEFFNGGDINNFKSQTASNCN